MLLISIDGLRADHLSRPDDYGLRIPTLRSLMRLGTTAEKAISVFPSSSYPAHVSIITGTRPAKHGVCANELFDPFSDDRGDYHFEHALIRSTTLYEVFHAAGRSTAAVTWPTTVKAPIDYNAPEIWQGGKFRETVIARSRAAATPGLIEAAERRFNFTFDIEHLEAHKNLIARHIVLTHRPDFLMMHYTEHDLKQHLHGPGSPEALAGLEAIDGWIAELLAAYQHEAQASAFHDRHQAQASASKSEGETQPPITFPPDLIVCVLSDHGFEPVHTEFQPNVVLREAGLLEYDANRKKIINWRAKAWVSGGSAAIILKDSADAEADRLARAAFLQHVSNTSNSAMPIARIIEADELKQLGSTPGATFAIDAGPGYTFGRAVSGEMSKPSFIKGQHGHLPDRPDMAAVFLIAGAKLPQGRRLPPVQLLDVAPTLARLAGLSMPAAEGRPIPLEDTR